MKKGWMLVAFLLLFQPALTRSVAGNPVRNVEAQWEPRKTWVFIVGLLEWKDSESFGSFPKENRRDAELVNELRAKGISADHIVYLQDRAATTRRIQTELNALLAKTRPDDFLFLYYCGHGYEDGNATYFASYDAGDRQKGWRVSSIFQTINSRFAGSRVFLTADCCLSGALTTGARAQSGGIAYAALASTTDTDSSTERWTFTESLLAGLRGNPCLDTNRDGMISLVETARFARDEMKLAEDQTAPFVATRGFDAGMPLAVAGRSTGACDRYWVTTEDGTYAARILESNGKRARVHYIGYPDDEDEWVSRTNIRPIAETKTVRFRAGRLARP